jgi:hypothetical protein
MNISGVVDSLGRARVLNAVPLQNAVLCAECDVVSDSPHDTCQVCGSHSLFNIARVFGGQLPKERANLVARGVVEIPSREFVLPFSKPHRPRKRANRSRQLSIVSDDNEIDRMDRGMLAGPQDR